MQDPRQFVSNAPKPITLTEEDIKKFWKYVDKTPGQGPKGDCWAWIGGRSPNGYGHMHISDGRTVRANRVAYLIQHGEDAIDYFVLHSCDWPPCCNGAHLSKGSQLENRQQAARRNRTAKGEQNGARLHPESLPRGEEHWTAKMPEATARKYESETVNAIRKLHAIQPHLSNNDIGRYFGIHQNVILQILSGKTWKHLPYDDSVAILPPVTEEFFKKRKLSPEDVHTILELSAGGMSQQKIAARFNVSQSAISKILRGGMWKEIVF